MSDFFLWLTAAYVLGSVPASYLAGRFGAHIDLRNHGSKSLGATNVQRVLGWKYSVPVGLFDIAKGSVAASVFGARAGDAAWMPLVVGVAAVLGHVFSAFLGFSGGKGVATAAGVVLVLAPQALGLSALIWLLTFVASGYVSLASMVSAVAFPLAAWVTSPNNYYTIAVGAGLAAFILVTHRSNIRRLVAGTENRFRGFGRGVG
ncbi:MAG: glycerol-3-phosphate 1-O-acyltransferase PlsY [Gemmatimonadales bacterium]